MLWWICGKISCVFKIQNHQTGHPVVVGLPPLHSNYRSQYDILTKTIFLCDWGPKNWSQLLRVSREYQLAAPGIIRVQEIRYRNDALRLCCVPCFVYENVREMSAGKHCWDQPEKTMYKVILLLPKYIGTRGPQALDQSTNTRLSTCTTFQN